MRRIRRNTFSIALLLTLLSSVLSLKTVANTLQPSVYSPQDIPTYNLGKIAQNYYVEFQLEYLTTKTKNDLSILIVQLISSQNSAIFDSSSDKCSGIKCTHRFFISETGNYALSFYALQDVVNEEIILFELQARTYEIDAPERSVTLLKLVDIIRSNPINYIFLAQQKAITVTYTGEEVTAGDSLITYALHKDTNLKQQKVELDPKTPYKTGVFIEHFGHLEKNKVMHIEVTLPAGFHVLIYISTYRENHLKVTYETDPFICPFSPEYIDKAHIFGGCVWELANSCADSLGNDTDCDPPVSITV